MIADKLASLAPRERAFLLIGALLVGAALLDRTALVFIAQQFRHMDEAIRTELYRLAENRRIIEAGRRVAEEYRALRKLLAERPPGVSAADRLRADLDELAGETGLGIQAIKHRETRQSPHGHYEECVMEIEKFETGLRELLVFLHRVSTSPKLLRVERLTLAPQKEGGLLVGSMSVARIFAVGEERRPSFPAAADEGP